MSLEKWVEYGWLKREPTSRDEIEGLLSIADSRPSRLQGRGYLDRPSIYRSLQFRACGSNSRTSGRWLSYVYPSRTSDQQNLLHGV
jgi:hypothetical protein